MLPLAGCMRLRFGWQGECFMPKERAGILRVDTGVVSVDEVVHEMTRTVSQREISFFIHISYHINNRPLRLNVLPRKGKFTK